MMAAHNTRDGRSARSVVRYRKVLHEADPLFEPAFALYKSAFPPEERMGKTAFVEIMKRKRLGQLSPSNFHLIVAIKEGRVVGMGSGRYIASANIGYVSYLVVDPAHSGQRLGPGIRNHLITSYRHDAELNGYDRLDAVVGEVQADNRWLRILAGRGQVMVLDIDYEQPRLGPDMERVPLVLYYQPLYPMPESLPVQEVVKLVRALYLEVYRMEEPESRPVFQEFLKKLEGRDRIGHRPLKHRHP